MKTLYISDLDGTLLNQNAELSEDTKNALNKLIADGVYFSVATARTAATSILILDEVTINVPIILMNGVLIYDMQKRQYIKKETLTKEKTRHILTAMKKKNQTGLMYALDGDKLVTYYENIHNIALQSFVDERIRKYNKEFTQVEDFETVDLDIIYFCYMDTKENIHELYSEIEQISGLRMEMYQDIYSSEDLWYIEVFCETASKYNAVQFLRQQYGFDYIVSFGDNLNDIPMFEASDECYAVENAKQEVKERATGIIESNNDNGVVKAITQKEYYENNER